MRKPKGDARAETVNQYKTRGRISTNQYKVVQKTLPKQTKVVQISGSLFGISAKTVIHCLGPGAETVKTVNCTTLPLESVQKAIQFSTNQTICTILPPESVQIHCFWRVALGPKP